MNKILASSGFGSAFLSACAPTLPSANVRLAAAPADLFKFSRLRAESLPSQLLVRGRVTRMRRFYGVIPGHIHVEAFAGQTSLGWQDTRWQRLKSRPFAISYFAVRLPIAPARVEEVRISYQRTAHGPAGNSGNEQ